MTLLKKFIEASKSFGWAYGLAFSFAFGQILFLLTDNTELKILLLVAFIVVVLIIYLLSLIFKYYATDDYLRYKNTIPLEITQIRFQRKVIFDNTSLDGKTAHTESNRILKNNMVDENYNDFRMELTSDVHVPILGEIDVTINGIPHPLNHRSVNVKYCQTCELKENFCHPEIHDATPKNTQVSFTVPFDIKPSETKTLRVSYNTEAYTPALQGNTDFISLECNRLTDELLIEVYLTDEMKERSNIEKSEYRDSKRGGYLEFTVIDGSEERMITTEKELADKKYTPYWERDCVVWRVPHPKIGYKYKLYFRILPRPVLQPTDVIPI